MKDHTLSLDSSGNSTRIEYASDFNVAVPFIDRHPTEGRSEKTAILTTCGETVNYAQLSERVNRCGNALKNLGLNSGDRLLMVIRDSPEFFYLFWGAIKSGIVPVPVNTLLRYQDYRFMLEDSECSGFAYSSEFAGDVELALKAAATKPSCVLLIGGEEDMLKRLLEAASPELNAERVKATDDCFWLYSSGTTGRPKGAVHRHRDMVVTSQYYGKETLEICDDDICYSAAKLFFAYGLGNAMTFPLWVGGTSLLDPGRPTPESTFANIERFRPSIYFGVPTLYAAQLQALTLKNVDLSSLRQCVSAGEALPADIFLRWHEQTGTVILDGIGSTEALHIFISNRSDDLKPGTSGHLVPGYLAKIVDENGNEVSQGEEGRLLIRGDSNCRTYWCNPEKTADTIIDGWLITGDTYRQDEDGWYVYGGRNDDMMKVGGIWCSPFEIEACLSEHPKVLEAAVVGRKDEIGLVKPEAHVVLNNFYDASDELTRELLNHCKSILAPYKYPRWVNFLEELPKTATGKIQRYLLRS